ncbi:SLBB domain-containing protein [Aquabacterium sp.]|uniref:SLBB domain-containing protein n=1 Tax=Aquabacterium sp. TaxID=1872578 RepID=UPI0024899EFA|nr:SLBB domain-containing protein [Aquabacterium sp.]MDI1259383.1 SLBB domain-containing protein [Aquabacterium sp.]
MTQRRSHPFRQIIALLTSFSVLVAPLAHGQGLGSFGNGGAGSDKRSDDPYGASSQGGFGASMGGASRQDSGLGRMDSSMGSPQIRQSSGDERSGYPNQGLGAQGRNGNSQQIFTGDQNLRPLPPNDFQKFVLESTGQSLSLYGATFFSQAGSYQPLANTPVSPDYTLGPGDEVLIRGWGAVDVDVKAVVDRNGLIHIPRVGAVSLGGVKSSQAEGVIHAAVGRYYRDFQLSVTLGQLRGVTVYVVGQARKPGAYTLASTSTLVSALFASGGPGANGSLRHVQVKRADRVVAELDLYAFLSKGDKSADIKLQDGDTIVIPAARGYVALTGKVNTPGVYELAGKNDSIDSVLALAGGLPVVADPKRAYLERVDPSRKPSRSVESFALDGEGLKRSLKSGDLLTVQSLTAEFGNAITLRGNVDQPVRLPWHQGMKVRDLIPNKAFLMSRASVKRQNEVLLTEDEKRRIDRNALRRNRMDNDQPSPDSLFGSEGRVTDSDSAGLRDVRETADTLAQRIGNLVDEVNLDYAVIERVDSNDVSVKLVPFNLGKALEDAASPENLTLQPGDVVTVFSVNDVRVPQAKRQVFVRVEGEVQRPGIYQMKPGDSLSQLVELAGGLTPDAYLFGSSFYREEVRKTQAENLERLVRRLEAQSQTKLSSSAASLSNVSGDAVAQLRVQAEAAAQKQALDRLRNLKPTGRIMLGLADDQATADALPVLKLENQDRLVVPARPDFVHVLGSVNTESSLIWQPGRTVQNYLDLAGLTSGADKDELFVIRADGSVLSDADHWFNRITSTKVLAGDLIVLPEKTDHESGWSVFTRNAKDITQIIYQFSLGAAAIKTLRD